MEAGGGPSRFVEQVTALAYEAGMGDPVLWYFVSRAGTTKRRSTKWRGMSRGGGRYVRESEMTGSFEISDFRQQHAICANLKRHCRLRFRCFERI